ncbi:hypothetical protein EC973_006670, partial [Apophysomyces ossiformis]
MATVTSKCHTLSDLRNVSTFGFRGEALAAIADAALLQITSRHVDHASTYMTIWKDGKLVHHSLNPCQRQPGTSIIVRDLFYKQFPVRRKQQRHLQTNVILEDVKRTVAIVAMTFPQASFILQDMAKKSNILVTKKDIKPFDVHEDDFKVHGYLGTKGFPNKVRIADLNHRWIAPNELYKAVIDTFEQSKPFAKRSTKRGKAWLERHPIFLIQVDCPILSSYDISVYIDTLYEHEGFGGLEFPKKLSKEDLVSAVVLGQIDHKFILIKTSSMLIIVDQHAADERIKLEKMLETLEDGDDLLQPEPNPGVNLTAEECQLARIFQSDLERWGIRLLIESPQGMMEPSVSSRSKYFAGSQTSSRFSQNNVFVTQLPRLIAGRCIANRDLLEKLLRDHLHDLKSNGSKGCPRLIMELLKSKACRVLKNLETEFKMVDKMVEREELRAFGSDTEKVFKELDVIRRKQIDLAGDHMALEIVSDIPQHSLQDDSEQQKSIDSFNRKELALKNLMTK